MSGLTGGLVKGVVVREGLNLTEGEICPGCGEGVINNLGVCGNPSCGYGLDVSGMMQKILNGNNCTSKPSNLTQSNRNVRKKIQKVQRSVGNTLASNQIEKLVDLKYGEFSVYKLIFTDGYVTGIKYKYLNRYYKMWFIQYKDKKDGTYKIGIGTSQHNTSDEEFIELVRIAHKVYHTYSKTP